MSPSPKVLAQRQAFPHTSKPSPILCIGCGEGSAWRGVDLHFVKVTLPVIGTTDGQTVYRHGNKDVCDAIKRTRMRKAPTQLLDAEGRPL